MSTLVVIPSGQIPPDLGLRGVGHRPQGAELQGVEAEGQAWLLREGEHNQLG